MNRVKILLVALTLAAAFYTANDAFSQQAQIVNGSFETGDFTGWTVVNQPGGEGDWFVYTGTVSPFSGFNILPPPHGRFAATTDQDGPGSHVLYQDIEVPLGVSEGCSVIIYYNNDAMGFINGPGLDFGDERIGANSLYGGGDVSASDDEVSTLDDSENQQARIDLMNPNSDPFDVGAGVLANLFITLPGDPNVLGYTILNFDLSPYAGTTVRFRAAEVDNQSNFLFSIDNLECGTPQPIAQTIPTLSEWGLIAMAGVLGIIGLLAIRRKKVTA